MAFHQNRSEVMDLLFLFAIERSELGVLIKPCFLMGKTSLRQINGLIVLRQIYSSVFNEQVLVCQIS